MKHIPPQNPQSFRNKRNISILPHYHERGGGGDENLRLTGWPIEAGQIARDGEIDLFVEHFVWIQSSAPTQVDIKFVENILFHLF